MLHRRGFSAGLLLGGVVPSIVSPGPSAGESLIVQCSFSPTSYFTVFWADTRAVKGESLGTVRINDNFCGLKLFRGDTDEADPSVSAYIGFQTSSPKISLSIKLFGGVETAEHSTVKDDTITFDFLLVPPPVVSPPSATFDPREVSARESNVNASPHVPTSSFSYSSGAPLQVQSASEQLETASVTPNSSLDYFEQSTARLYKTLSLPQRIDYLESRLASEQLSCAMRVSVAIARKQAIELLRIESEAALLEGVAQIEVFYE